MTTALPYQLKCVRKIHHFGGRALIADEMGLGKTFEALLYAHECDDVWPALVICPAGAKFTWQNQALEHFNLRSEILSGTRPPRNRLMIPHRLVIINFDILKPWMEYIKTLDPRLIIVDECHKLGSLKTLRTRLVGEICDEVPKVLGLSGSPFTNRPAQMWPMLHILRPDKFKTFRKFAKKHCKPKRHWYGMTFNGAERLDELNEKLNRVCMVRRLKSEVMKDLPAKMRTTVPLEVSSRREYKMALNDFRKWLKSNFKTKLRSSKAEELVKVGYLKRLAAKLKMENAIEWIDDFLETSGQKAIIYAIHKSVIRQLREHYGRKAVIIDGSTTAIRRQAHIDQFNNDERTRLLIGNIEAAGTNWSCKSSSNVIFVELSWTPGEHIQAEDRIHGLGRGEKGKSASIYYLVSRDTIEERICQLLQKKQADFHHALDGAPMNELSIYDLLVTELRKAA